MTRFVTYADNNEILTDTRVRKIRLNGGPSRAKAERKLLTRSLISIGLFKKGAIYIPS